MNSLLRLPRFNVDFDILFRRSYELYSDITNDRSEFEAQVTASVIGPEKADKICADTYFRQWREKSKRLELYYRLFAQPEAPLDPVPYSWRWGSCPPLQAAEQKGQTCCPSVPRQLGLGA